MLRLIQLTAVVALSTLQETVVARGGRNLLVIDISLMVAINLSIRYPIAPYPLIGVKAPTGQMYLIDAATYHANMAISINSNTHSSFAASAPTELIPAICTLAFPSNIISRVNNTLGNGRLCNNVWTITGQILTKLEEFNYAIFWIL